MSRELLKNLLLGTTGDSYTGKLYTKPFYFNEGAFVEEPYAADLELPVSLLEGFKNLLTEELFQKAEQLVAAEFLETANMSRAAEDDLTISEFQRRLTLVRLEVSEAELYFNYFDGGECGGHYLTLSLSWSGEALDFNMMG
jgi:hypothetical protein